MMYTFGVNVPRCQHVRTTGIRCGSPALHGEKHCYYHTAFGQPTRVIRDFEDAESIQLALRQVVNWIAQGMDTKRAALTLYALQIASGNLKHMSRIIHASDVVRELPEETDAREARAEARSKKHSRASESLAKKPVASSRPRNHKHAPQSVKSVQIRGEEFPKKSNGHASSTSASQFPASAGTLDSSA